MLGKYLYLYLDNESMTGYVGETDDIKRRHNDHKNRDYIYEDKWPGRMELVNKIGEPVTIKADFKSMNAVKFAEHAIYEKYKAEGYDMLQKPPHPNIFKKYHDKVDECKICDELGCDFTKERLEYILAVYRVSKLCPTCNKPFYYDPIKHTTEKKFNGRKYCSQGCVNKGVNSVNYGKKLSKEINMKKSESMKGKNNGENNGQVKLTARMVQDIKYMLLTMTYYGAITDIARIYGVDQATISLVNLP